MKFSATSRPAIKQQLQSETFDLLVIGGGITGCGIALDAALRGMKVALVEKQDFASGTSSRSTKLIHGGLRYLKQLEFKLVHDVGSERAIVFRNARHLVIPERMLLPIITNGSLGKYSSSLGLWIYDLLAGVKSGEKRRMLSAKQTLQEEPLLDSQKLVAGGLYYEYRTDDARLVIELAKSAHRQGTALLNYAGVESLLYNEQQQVCGARVKDSISGNAFDVRANHVVNAAGPFVDLIRKADNSLFGKRLQLTKGVHLVFDRKKFPIKQALYFDVPDGRMIFAIPRGEVTYVGTTDTVYNQRIDHPRVSLNDVGYLLNAIRNMFPSVQLTVDDIQSTWAGLRPLIYEDGKSPSELSRKDEIFESQSGLLSIAGGKLTGYRLMAEKIVDRVAAKLPASKLKPSSTKNFRLTGGEFESQEAFDAFATELFKGKNATELVWLKKWLYRYGSETPQLLESAKTLQAEGFRGDPFLEAEVRYSAANEMSCFADDFLIRRSGMAFFEKPFADAALNQIHQSFSAQQLWSNEEQQHELERVQQLLRELVSFES
ncbi:MAG: glycerol-3-phosphate dehydrogenase/oxidase [Chitinophagales bacterium]